MCFSFHSCCMRFTRYLTFTPAYLNSSAWEAVCLKARSMFSLLKFRCVPSPSHQSCCKLTCIWRSAPSIFLRHLLQSSVRVAVMQLYCTPWGLFQSLIYQLLLEERLLDLCRTQYHNTFLSWYIVNTIIIINLGPYSICCLYIVRLAAFRFFRVFSSFGARFCTKLDNSGFFLFTHMLLLGNFIAFL